MLVSVPVVTPRAILRLHKCPPVHLWRQLCLGHLPSRCSLDCSAGRRADGDVVRSPGEHSWQAFPLVAWHPTHTVGQVHGSTDYMGSQGSSRKRRALIMDEPQCKTLGNMQQAGSYGQNGTRPMCTQRGSKGWTNNKKGARCPSGRRTKTITRPAWPAQWQNRHAPQRAHWGPPPARQKFVQTAAHTPHPLAPFPTRGRCSNKAGLQSGGAEGMYTAQLPQAQARPASRQAHLNG